MNDQLVPRLEDQPVEMFVEIFEYLTAADIYMSFSRLNHRLNSILRALPNVTVVVKDPSDPVLSFFHSFKAIRIDCYGTSESHSLRDHWLRSYPSPADFKWYPRRFLEIERIIRPTICSQLRCLILPVTPSWLLEFVLTGGFARLERLYLDGCQPVVFPLSSTVQLRSVRVLTIRDQTASALEWIVEICPALNYLDYSCQGILPTFATTAHCYASMKYLRLQRPKCFIFQKNPLDSLLSLFPNLLKFQLTVNQCHDSNETIDFEQLANCLSHRLPRLKFLDLRLYMANRMRCFFHEIHFAQIARLHPLFQYLQRCQTLITITSYAFVPTFAYSARYTRVSSSSSSH